MVHVFGAILVLECFAYLNKIRPGCAVSGYFYRCTDWDSRNGANNTHWIKFFSHCIKWFCVRLTPLDGLVYKKSVGTEPLLVPPLEALACAHRRKTSNVQSPRKYVKSRWPTYASRHPSHRISIYISMSIYHCICLAYDIETARFQEAKNGSASKRFCHYVCDSPYWRAGFVTRPQKPVTGLCTGVTLQI